MYLEYLWNLLSKEWRPVSKDEAANNRYYGLRGWLLLFYVGAAFGAVTYSIDLLSPSVEKYYWVFGERPGVIRAALLVALAGQLPVLILAPLKHRLMPRLWIAGMWISVITWIAAYDMPGRVDAMLLSVAATIVGSALLTWYVLHSKRVNVTYLHRVPTGESADGAHAASAVAGTIPRPPLYQRAHRASRIFWGLAIFFVVMVALAAVLTP